jgi:hypothetical protein
MAATAMWFTLAILAFELACHVLFNHTPLKSAHLRSYFWYGESYEGKLRGLAATPNLPQRSVFFAGWLDEGTWKGRPDDVDVTVYGSSFAGNLATAMQTVRPEARIRSVGGPGAPLNHTYALYGVDRNMRRTKVAVIGVVSENVSQILTMNIGSVHAQTPMPYFFPRYDVVNGELKLTAGSLINSADELKKAFADPALWKRQLEVLSRHDDAYRPELFEANFVDASLFGRLVRRSLATRHAQNYGSATYDRSGFRADAYQVQVFKAVLSRMVSDLRSEGVRPIVVLFSTRGQGDHLRRLLNDDLKRDAVPFLTSNDFCTPADRSTYLPDGHFSLRCDREMATAALKLIDQEVSATRQ